MITTGRIDRILSNLGLTSRLKAPVSGILCSEPLSNSNTLPQFQAALSCSGDLLLTSFAVKEYIARNKVTVNGKRVKAADHVNVKDVRVAGNPLQYPETLHIMLHKPRGYVCSRVREAEAKMIYDLLPASFLRRNPLLVAAGRLDKWASGLLVLSQDGELVQKLTSPKRKAGAMGKVYEVQLQKELTGQESVAFASGELMLRSESEPCKPAGFEVIDPENRIVRITLFEGRYHQLRRMLAALGNRAVTIHRVQTGPLRIGDLPAGHWRTLSQAEVEAIQEL